MDVRTLITEAQRLVGRVDSGWDSRSQRALNLAQRQYAMERPWPSLYRHETFVTDGTARLLLPPRVLSVLWLADKTNKRSLFPDNFFDRNSPNSWLAGTSGGVFRWKEMGFRPSFKQFTAASPSALRFTTSVAPPSAISVYVSGLAVDTNSSGTPDYLYRAQEYLTVTATGIVSGSILFATLDTIGKDDFTPADIQVWDTSSNPVARIATTEFRSEYREIELLYVPTSGTQIEVGYTSCPPALTTDPQVVHPAVDTDFLIYSAASQLAQEQNQTSISEILAGKASRILERRANHEFGHGEKDLGFQPDPRYWETDDYHGLYYGP